MLTALLLDHIFAEPRRFHALVAFGRWADFIEKQLNKHNLFFNRRERSKQDANNQVTRNKAMLLQGLIAWLLAVIPAVVLLSIINYQLENISAVMALLLQAVVLYAVIGWRSLQQHIEAIEQGLAESLQQGQQALSMIVSRKTHVLDEKQIRQAALESLLENSNDALFTSLFLYLAGELIAGVGLELAVLHRLANTLDAMWGYRSEQFLYFGRVAAKIDDYLAYLPARLSALLFLSVSYLDKNYNFSSGLNCWREQAKHCISPNGGVVMCTGAGVLQVKLSDKAYYNDVWSLKPVMGCDNEVDKFAIERAIDLINKSLRLFILSVMVVLFISLFISLFI